jgi:hypothetical protein
MKHPHAGQFYEGFRNHHVYEVIAIAEDAETLDLYVVYKQLPDKQDEIIDDKVYTRLIKSFTEEVELADGTKVPRFKEIKKPW